MSFPIKETYKLREVVIKGMKIYDNTITEMCQLSVSYFVDIVYIRTYVDDKWTLGILYTRI